MDNARSVTVRFFSYLEAYAREKGIRSPVQVPVPDAGMTGLELAEKIGLPVDRIEAVFRNGVVQNLDKPLYPGDRVAFLPPGTPGPYRVLLGIAREKPDPAGRGKKEEDPGT